MAITNVVKNVISGSLGSAEIFQTSYWVQLVGGPPAPTDASAAAEAASAPFQAVMTAAKVLLSPDCEITAYDQYGYTALPGPAIAHGHADLAIVGTGPASHPYQVAAVTTLRTGTPGRSGRGRMYWPASGAGIAGAGLFGGDLNTLTDKLALLFTAISSGGDHACVVSLTDSVTRPITSVDNDQVPDTQRRRTNKLFTARHSHAV